MVAAAAFSQKMVNPVWQAKAGTLVGQSGLSGLVLFQTQRILFPEFFYWTFGFLPAFLPRGPAAISFKVEPIPRFLNNSGKERPKF